VILFAEVQAGDFAAESAAEELPQKPRLFPSTGTANMPSFIPKVPDWPSPDTASLVWAMA